MNPYACNVINMATSPGTAGGPWSQAFFAWRNAMIARGFRILGSGDTLTFENQGQTAGSTGTGAGGGYDIITSSGGGTNGSYVAGGIGNVNSTAPGATSWFRMATPVDAPHYREWLFRCQATTNGSTSRHYLSVFYARNNTAFAANGAAGIAPLPTDTTQYVSFINPQDNNYSLTPTQNQLLGQAMAPGAAGKFHYAIGDHNVDYDWVFWTTRDSNSQVFAIAGQLAISSTYASMLGEVDPDPYLYILNSKGSDGVTQDATALDIVAEAVKITPRESDTSTTYSTNVRMASDRLWTNDVDAGTYAVQIVLPYANGALGVFSMTQPTDRDILYTRPAVVRAHGGAGLEFYKGQLKHRTLCLAYRSVTAGGTLAPPPEHPTRERRMTHGNVSLPIANGEDYLGVASTEVWVLANEGQVTMKLQAIWDTGLNTGAGGWVYYRKTEIDAAPLSTETYPNHTDNLDTDTHIVLGEILDQVA